MNKTESFYDQFLYSDIDRLQLRMNDGNKLCCEMFDLKMMERHPKLLKICAKLPQEDLSNVNGFLQRVVLSPPNQEVKGSSTAWGLSVWGLHVLPVCARISSQSSLPTK